MRVRKGRVVLLLVVLLGGIIILRNKVFTLDSSLAFIVGGLLCTCIFWHGGGTIAEEELEQEDTLDIPPTLTEDKEDGQNNCMNRSRRRAIERQNGEK